ncbi:MULTISPECIES: hypothetical protein [unclassified Rhizobium]|jgi:hypothetical protein|uniref:hypothetical protein n=1 Tax=unclassified Rhizobium TaxID=2613769 RepID=UPI000B1ACC19|nr:MULTISPECIES: hypothetical protein [unclassified Rhizobium]
MSNEVDLNTDIPDATIALLLEERGADELTDILVESLHEAFRIMEDEIYNTVH